MKESQQGLHSAHNFAFSGGSDVNSPSHYYPHVLDGMPHASSVDQFHGSAHDFSKVSDAFVLIRPTASAIQCLQSPQFDQSQCTARQWLLQQQLPSTHLLTPANPQQLLITPQHSPLVGRLGNGEEQASWGSQQGKYFIKTEKEDGCLHFQPRDHRYFLTQSYKSHETALAPTMVMQPPFRGIQQDYGASHYIQDQLLGGDRFPSTGNEHHLAPLTINTSSLALITPTTSPSIRSSSFPPTQSQIMTLKDLQRAAPQSEEVLIAEQLLLSPGERKTSRNDIKTSHSEAGDRSAEDEEDMTIHAIKASRTSCEKPDTVHASFLLPSVPRRPFNASYADCLTSPQSPSDSPSMPHELLTMSPVLRQYMPAHPECSPELSSQSTLSPRARQETGCSHAHDPYATTLLQGQVPSMELHQHSQQVQFNPPACNSAHASQCQQYQQHYRRQQKPEQGLYVFQELPTPQVRMIHHSSLANSGLRSSQCSADTLAPLSSPTPYFQKQQYNHPTTHPQQQQQQQQQQGNQHFTKSMLMMANTNIQESQNTEGVSLNDYGLAMITGLDCLVAQREDEVALSPQTLLNQSISVSAFMPVPDARAQMRAVAQQHASQFFVQQQHRRQQEGDHFMVTAKYDSKLPAIRPALAPKCHDEFPPDFPANVNSVPLSAGRPSKGKRKENKSLRSKVNLKNGRGRNATSQVARQPLKASVLASKHTAEFTSGSATHPPTACTRLSIPTPTLATIPAAATATTTSRSKIQCHKCHRNFTRQFNMRSHLLVHARIKPFSCLTLVGTARGACERCFTRRHDLIRHIKAKHPVVYSVMYPSANKNQAAGVWKKGLLHEKEGELMIMVAVKHEGSSESRGGGEGEGKKMIDEKSKNDIEVDSRQDSFDDDVLDELDEDQRALYGSKDDGNDADIERIKA